VKGAVVLAEALEEASFGAKAVQLGEAVREGLPVPPGVALSGPTVEQVASGEESAIEEVEQAVRSLHAPLAVRSSAVGEDSAEASFAGQHLTLLNVPSTEEVCAAVREIWWSGNSDSAITYRQRVGLFTRPSVGVVVQELLNPDVAGVMFTQNPINGADERMIEASWGLGEAVVAGLVIPDSYRLSKSGEVLDRRAGVKKIAIRSVANGGTLEEEVAPELVERHCLDDGDLEQLNVLASECERVYGPARDLEWAFAGGQLYLLQSRAVTKAASSRLAPPAPESEPPVDALERVPLFAGLDEEQVSQVAGLFKERRFSAGETVAKEGAGGAAFFMIISGEASVSVKGRERGTLKSGDYFGEIALIDGGPRSATVTADTDLVCHGLTYWDFRPLVRQNATIGWTLLQSLAKKLRVAEAE